MTSGILVPPPAMEPSPSDCQGIPCYLVIVDIVVVITILRNGRNYGKQRRPCFTGNGVSISLWK